jgi:hypothetical protein
VNTTSIFTIGCKEFLPSAKVATSGIGADFGSADLTGHKTAAM